MKFDFTFNFSNLIELGVIIVTLWTLHQSNVRRMERLETKFGIVFDWFVKNVIGKQASEQS